MTLTRKAPMKRTRPTPTLPPKMRAVLVERSQGWCEARLYGCTGRATDAAHRIASKMGGRPLGDDLRLSNFLHLCRTCHRWCEGNPVLAEDLGLMLNESRDPTVEPVAYQNAGWVRLDDDGGMWPA